MSLKKDPNPERFILFPLLKTDEQSHYGTFLTVEKSAQIKFWFYRDFVSLIRIWPFGKKPTPKFTKTPGWIRIRLHPDARNYDLNSFKILQKDLRSGVKIEWNILTLHLCTWFTASLIYLTFCILLNVTVKKVRFSVYQIIAAAA